MTDWRALAQALNRTMSAHAPEWTDRNDSDPGITILQVFAFLSESLLYRGVVEGGRSAAARTIHALDPYIDQEPIEVQVNGEPWRRVDGLTGAERTSPVFTFDESTGVIRFGDGVHGRVPERGSTISARYRDGRGAEGNTSVAARTAWPLRNRDYRIAVRENGTIQVEACVILGECWSGTKHHLRALHGTGIVEGLQVAVEQGGTAISVQPGLAIDGEGREILVCEKANLPIPPNTASPAWIAVEYAERLIDPVPIAPEGTEQRRVEEGCNIVLASAPPTSRVGIARLVREQNGWRVDTTFVPSRPR